MSLVKKVLLFVLSFAFMLCSVCFISTMNSVYADDIAPTLALERGASVRISSDGNGIRFAMIMTEGDYADVQEKVANGAISNVKYGILIAPAVYDEVLPLNEQNVFTNPKYNWSVNGDEYTEETGKTRITNLVSDKLGEYEYRDGYVGMFGSIVELKHENIANEFIGVGYMQYTVDVEGVDTVKYIFTERNDNVMSMAYVAQRYIENNPNSEYNSVLQNTYLDNVKTVESSYTTEYYLEDAEGNFVLDETKNEVTVSTIGATATSVQKEISGYVYDRGNELNVEEAQVYANDKTVLKAYYKSNSYINADGSFYNSDFALTYSAADCDKPTGWTYDAGAYGVLASPGNVRLTENGTIYSTKLSVKPGSYLYGSVFANDWDEELRSNMTLGIIFYGADDVIISTNNGSQISVPNGAGYAEYATRTYKVPDNALYVQLSIKGQNEVYINTAKINVLDTLAIETADLNSDGTFFNSDFSLYAKPDGAECDKPVGWAYSSGQWGVQANAGYVALVEGGTVTSPKLTVAAGTFVRGSVMAGDWNVNNNTTLILGVIFYDAAGNVLQANNSSSIAVTNVGWLNCAEYKTTTYCAPENTAYAQLKIVGQNYAHIDSAKISLSNAHLIEDDGTFYNSDFKLTETPTGMESPKPLGWTYSSTTGYDVYATGDYIELRNGAYVESVLLAVDANTSISATVNAVDWDNSYGKFKVGISYYNENQDLLETTWSDDIQLTNARNDFDTDAVAVHENAAYVKVIVKFVSGHNYIYSVKLNVNA